MCARPAHSLLAENNETEKEYAQAQLILLAWQTNEILLRTAANDFRSWHRATHLRLSKLTYD